MRVYLSGPISGLTVNQAQNWRGYVTERLLAKGFEVLNPLRGAEGQQPPRKRLSSKSPEDAPELSDRAFVARDRYDVLNCDVVLCNLIGAERVSIGTLFELAWAMMANKLTVVVMEKRDNIHSHAFVREAGLVFHDLDEAVDYILTCAGEEPGEGEKE